MKKKNNKKFYTQKKKNIVFFFPFRSFISLTFVALIHYFCIHLFLQFLLFQRYSKRRLLNEQVISASSHDLMHCFDNRFYDYSVFCTYLTVPPGTHLRPNHRFDLQPRMFAVTMTRM